MHSAQTGHNFFVIVCEDCYREAVVSAIMVEMTGRITNPRSGAYGRPSEPV
jgi:hypothetical protein